MRGIVGEEVTVLRPSSDSADPFRSPVRTWAPETVDNVLVAPGTSPDETDSNRPDGVRVVFTLHFPKAYTASLRGCRVIVAGDEYEVVGDPQAYEEWNTPGPWNRPVEVSRMEG